MAIHLSKDLEQFIQDAVTMGLYAREDDVICDAVTRLKQAMPGEASQACQASRQGD
jgi:Arc/MetJ-type ribon-helix-helix transcriptional regulator